MAEYTNQRQLNGFKIFKVNATESEVFVSISDPSKLIERVINILYRDMNVVDAMICQMEKFCVQRGIEVSCNEAGRGELQQSVDWLRHNFIERVSGEQNVSSFGCANFSTFTFLQLTTCSRRFMFSAGSSTASPAACGRSARWLKSSHPADSPTFFIHRKFSLL
jgi:hypothetical protein